TPVADAFPRSFFGHETAFWHGFRLPLAWTLAKAQVEFCRLWEKDGVSPEIVPERGFVAIFDVFSRTSRLDQALPTKKAAPPRRRGLGSNRNATALRSRDRALGDG